MFIECLIFFKSCNVLIYLIFLVLWSSIIVYMWVMIILNGEGKNIKREVVVLIVV